MRYRFVLATALFIVMIPAAALAKGPSGSSENSKGQVKCGKGVVTPVATFYASPTGFELCDSNNLPPDGRIIVTTGYVSIDGDSTNPQQSSGFIRVDKSGPSCGDTKHHDATVKGGSCVPPGPPV
jgi:hypothetical protein